MGTPPEDLAETYLRQSPACCWVTGAGHVFLRVWGDPSSIFGATAAKLEGHTLAEAGGKDAAAWGDRFGRALAGEHVMLRERHGTTTWYTSLFPLRAAGDVLYAGGMTGEISFWSTAERELRSTVLGALKAQEHQRHVGARFMHDVVGQNLTAFGLQLDLIRMDLGDVSPAACSRIAEMQRVLESMMEGVREYSNELNPSAVERTGLRAALDRLTNGVRHRFAGTLRTNVDPSLKIEPRFATAFYSIAQEAVENALQHSGCSAIEIAIKSSRSGPSLEVRDNGKGFDPDDVLEGRRGLGLLVMEHYAAQAGLDLVISSRRETGTTVRAAPTGRV